MLGHDVLGTGPRTVLVMNDWLSDTSSWNDARAYLDTERYTWLFTDLRGYGRSKAQRGEYNLPEAAQDVLALADALHLSDFDLVGHSMSTLVAMHLAQHHPQRVHRAVVLTPAPPAGMGAESGTVAAIESLALGDDEKRGYWLRMRFGEHVPPGWARFKTAQWRAAAQPEAVAAYAAMFARDGLPNRSARISIPLLAVTGGRDDAIMQRASVLELLGPISDRLLVSEIPSCGHYPMQETPVALIAILERFLGSEDALGPG
jgi:3-oxoadipate enol-lactonase